MILLILHMKAARFKGTVLIGFIHFQNGKIILMLYLFKSKKILFVKPEGTVPLCLLMEQQGYDQKSPSLRLGVICFEVQS